MGEEAMAQVYAALGFEFGDFDELLELIQEAPGQRTIPVDGFDAAMTYQDPSGARMTALQYEGEWATLPGFRSDNTVDASTYRVSPYLSLVELRRAGDGEVFNQFAAASDEAFALPAGNPAGGRKLRATELRMAAAGTDYTLYDSVESWRESKDAYDAAEPSMLYSPSTERFYRDFHPGNVNPFARVGGVIRSAQKRTNRLTGNEFVVATLATPAGNLPLLLTGKVPEEGQVFFGAACMLASAGFWETALAR